MEEVIEENLILNKLFVQKDNCILILRTWDFRDTVGITKYSYMLVLVTRV